MSIDKFWREKRQVVAQTVAQAWDAHNLVWAEIDSPYTSEARREELYALSVVTYRNLIRAANQ